MASGFEITADDLKSRMKKGDPLFLVNVRHHQDWDLAVMKAKGALRVPDDELEAHLEEIPRDRTVVVYSTCPGDEPSIEVAQKLQKLGWQNVHPLHGGFKAYLSAGLPVEEIGVGNSTRRVMFL